MRKSDSDWPKEQIAGHTFTVFMGKRWRNEPVEPMAGFSSCGIFSMNERAYEALGSPQAVTLHFDTKRRLVGLRASELGYRFAYKVRKNGRHYLVSTTAFVWHHRITCPVPQQIATMGDGYLVIQLSAD